MTMTIALGLPCRDGLMIFADEQVLAEGGSKYQEERISCVELFGSVVVSSYAGVPGLWKEATEKLSHKLSELQGPDDEGDVCVTPRSVYESADEVFTGMGRPLNLQMLIAVGGVFDSPDLFVFDRGAMHRATGLACLGAGESSVIRYLVDNLYSPSMNLDEAKNLGIYLISKAAQYIDGVGAPMDAVIVRGHQPEWLGDTEIKEREAAMLGREQSLLKQILTPPFSSSATWP
jgi:20S proteasome alpha/beta subunit